MVSTEEVIELYKEALARAGSPDLGTFIMTAILSKYNVPDDFIVMNADRIVWKHVILYHGISPGLMERFENEISIELEKMKLSLSKEFFERYKALVFLLKEMFPGLLISYNSNPINIYTLHRGDRPEIVITMTPENSKTFQVNLKLSLSDNGFWRMKLYGKERFEITGSVTCPVYYEDSFNQSFDHRLYFYLKYFKYDHKDNVLNTSNIVNLKVTKMIEEWTRKKMSEEHEMKNAINEMKIKKFF